MSTIDLMYVPSTLYHNMVIVATMITNAETSPYIALARMYIGASYKSRCIV